MILAALLLSSAYSSAWALGEPAPGKQDPRMRVVAYSPTQSYPIDLEVGHVVAVTFSDHEIATDAWGSNSEAMKVDLSGHFAFYKASKPFGARSFFIKTRLDNGKDRLYVFQVTAVAEPMQQVPTGVNYITTAMATDPPPPDPNMYDLRFTYPQDESEERRAAAAKRQQEAVQRQLAQSHPTDPNYKYMLQGQTAADWNLLPSREVYDDGSSTYFVFPGQMRVPVIYVVNPDGKEAVADYTFNSATGVVTVGMLAEHWRIRDGDSELCVFNKAYNPVPDRNTTGTISPDVVRITK